MPGAGPQGGAVSTSQMQVNLTGAKETRKRAELDAQLLANRIALLKQEEEKAWKKIEETRKRATEVTHLRAQNQQKFQQKEQFYQAKWDSIQKAQASNTQKRERAKATRDATKNGLLENKHARASETKQNSHEMLMAKKEREQSEKLINNDRGNNIRQKKEEAKRKLEEDRLAQLEKFREDYEALSAQENLLRERTEALVAKMEQEEMELIQRLQNTQTVQRSAYEELEAALASTSSQAQDSLVVSGKPSARAITITGGPKSAGSEPRRAA